MNHILCLKSKNIFPVRNHSKRAVNVGSGSLEMMSVNIFKCNGCGYEQSCCWQYICFQVLSDCCEWEETNVNNDSFVMFQFSWFIIRSLSIIFFHTIVNLFYSTLVILLLLIYKSWFFPSYIHVACPILEWTLSLNEWLMEENERKEPKILRREKNPKVSDMWINLFCI